MSSPAKAWTLRRTIPSDCDTAHDLIDEIVERLEHEGWGMRPQFQIRMAAEEAITNAIEHGNKRDPQKTVDIDCRVSAEEFWLDVTDEGCGFCRERVADCTDADRLELPRGRGVLLIESFMSSTRYLGCGNRIQMRRLRDDPKFERSTSG